MQGKNRGQERRRHRVFVTRNTEYHFRDEVCVAVKDVKSGMWLQQHQALRRKVTSGVRFFAQGGAAPTSFPPNVGESLYFGEEDGERELITSALCSHHRPSKSDIDMYEEQSGEPDVWAEAFAS
ncbi:MAG TPA: hypothetical protein VFQ61_31145 [Polyangiaceae bacterium]|nr:hypothetical protein [Polyangiaceae bacterium]